jgi:hypothetical protein
MSLLHCRICHRLAAPEEKRCPRCRQLLRDPLRPPHLIAAVARDRRARGLLLGGAGAAALLLLAAVQLFIQVWAT